MTRDAEAGDGGTRDADRPMPGWPAAHAALAAGRIAAVLRHGGRTTLYPWPTDGAAETSGGGPAPGAGPLIFPGSFDPVHDGHRRMCDLAEAIAGRGCAWEVAVVNADKPPAAAGAVLARLAGLGADRPVWLTATATFAAKARVFPGATFVVGADTVARIGRPRFYGGEAGRDAALAELARRGARFLVFGRLLDGTFREWTELDLPPALAALCRGVDGRTFRSDESSTRLRGLRDRAGTVPPA